MSKSRPLSPHLGIYKPQISSVFSILHRITGVSNFFGMLVFLWWIVFLTFSAENYTTSLVYTVSSSLFGKVILIGWSFALFLHASTGIRHLFWDAGYGFDKNFMAKTAWLSLLTAAVLTSISWCIYFNI